MSSIFINTALRDKLKQREVKEYPESPSSQSWNWNPCFFDCAARRFPSLRRVIFFAIRTSAIPGDGSVYPQSLESVCDSTYSSYLCWIWKPDLIKDTGARLWMLQCSPARGHRALCNEHWEAAYHGLLLSPSHIVYIHHCQPNSGGVKGYYTFSWNTVIGV